MRHAFWFVVSAIAIAIGSGVDEKVGQRHAGERHRDDSVRSPLGVPPSRWYT